MVLVSSLVFVFANNLALDRALSFFVAAGLNGLGALGCDEELFVSVEAEVSIGVMELKPTFDSVCEMECNVELEPLRWKYAKGEEGVLVLLEKVPVIGDFMVDSSSAVFGLFWRV